MRNGDRRRESNGTYMDRRKQKFLEALEHAERVLGNNLWNYREPEGIIENVHFAGDVSLYFLQLFKQAELP